MHRRQRCLLAYVDMTGSMIIRLLTIEDIRYPRYPPLDSQSSCVAVVVMALPYGHHTPGVMLTCLERCSDGGRRTSRGFARATNIVHRRSLLKGDAVFSRTGSIPASGSSEKKQTHQLRLRVSCMFARLLVRNHQQFFYIGLHLRYNGKRNRIQCLGFISEPNDRRRP